MNRRDPRIRRTLDDLSTTFDNLTTTTQTAAFSFTKSYLDPCLASLSNCLDASCAPCVAYRRDRARARRQRHFSRASSRPELVFDFYNDEWEDDEEDVNERTGLLGGWGGAEGLDRILAGSGTQEQPRNQKRTMNYGARDARDTRAGARARGKSLGKGGEADPTVVPGSSMFGFLERLPWKIGGQRGLRYKPSAANLEGLGKDGEEIHSRTEGEALLDDSEDTDSWGEGTASGRQHKRQRSNTVASRDTANSLSSRGDLFPSDEEDDAVALDDDFAMPLERRMTGEDASSGQRGSRSRLARTFSGFTTASRSTKSSNRKGRRIDAESGGGTPGSETRSTPASEAKLSMDEARSLSTESLPTMEEIEQEDAQVREEEDEEVERKRNEAKQVAAQRGLAVDEIPDTAEEHDAGQDAEPGTDAANLVPDAGPSHRDLASPDLLQPTRDRTSTSEAGSNNGSP
jgi:hypothetical protein